MPLELQTKSFLWEHCYLPLLHAPLELGEVDRDSFSLGWKLCQRGEFRLESVNFLLRRMFMISWFGGQSLITVDDKNILKVAWDIYQPVLIKNKNGEKSTLFESVLFSQKCTGYFVVLSHLLHSALVLRVILWADTVTTLWSIHDKMFFRKISNTLKAVAKFTDVILFLDLPSIRQHALNVFHCIFCASSEGVSGISSGLCLSACFREENR